MLFTRGASSESQLRLRASIPLQSEGLDSHQAQPYLNEIAKLKEEVRELRAGSLRLTAEPQSPTRFKRSNTTTV
eukprot:919037-Prymnesium_polylepis.1